MAAALGCLNSLVEDLPPSLYAFGVGSVLLVVLNQVPQYRKILHSRSAEGLSSITLGIGNVSSAFNVVNLTILHANQVPLCFTGDAGAFFRCQASFLVLYSAIAGFAACAPFYFLKVAFSSGVRKRRSLAFGLWAQVGVISLASVPALVAVSPWGTCQRFRDYANVVGFLNTVLLCCQYVPQIYVCYARKGSGAVSYITLGFDALGGYAMVLYKVFATHERLSSWLPYLIFHSSELGVIAVAFWFDFTRKGKGARGRDKTLLPYEPGTVEAHSPGDHEAGDWDEAM